MKQKIRIHPDVWLAAASLAICVIVWTESAKYPPDVKLFPRLFTVAFAVLTVFILIKGIRLSIAKTKDPDSVPESEFWAKLKTVKYPFILLCLIIGYLVLIHYIGMYLASVVYAVIAMRFFGEKRWLINLGVSVVMAVLLYLLMAVALKVTLPVGVLIKPLLK